jgi:predicted acylesterase/phospholipase RssA
MYRILSLDGGGIKGLFTATMLDRLQRACPKLLDRVDLIAGTSTGGIIALSLADGKTPSEIASLYRDRAGKIFHDSFLDDVKDLGKALGAEYSSGELERELTEQFGDRTLGQLGKRVLVPTFDLDAPATRRRPRAWKPKFFHNFPGSDSDRAERVVDVALRTSAAPTYFPAYQGFVDGGVVANNPSMAAVAQTLDRRAAGVPLDALLLLSVGTGLEPQFIPGREIDWGWVQWARPLAMMMISGVMGVADFQCRQLLGKRYYRLDRVLDREIDLDDTREATLAYLVEAAKRVDLRGVRRWLKTVGWDDRDRRSRPGGVNSGLVAP